MTRREIVVTQDKKALTIHLIIEQGGQVQDEIILPLQLARSLRSALEAVISGRKPACRATEKKVTVYSPVCPTAIPGENNSDWNTYTGRR